MDKIDYESNGYTYNVFTTLESCSTENWITLIKLSGDDADKIAFAVEPYYQYEGSTPQTRTATVEVVFLRNTQGVMPIDITKTFTITQEATLSKYLTFDIVSGGTIAFAIPSSSPMPEYRSISYRVNNGAWQKRVLSYYEQSFNVVSGDVVEFKSDTTAVSGSTLSFSSSTAYYNLSGNLASLTSPSVSYLSEPKYYWGLFSRTNVVSVSGLTLPMFTWESGRQSGPNIYIQAGAASYSFMFSGCTHLTSASFSLPNKTIDVDKINEGIKYNQSQGLPLYYSWDVANKMQSSFSFAYMFANCSNLVTAPELPSTTLGYYITSVASGATEGYYYGMFSGCTSLRTAPELPATDLVYGSYAYMFKGCTLLNNIKCNATSLIYNGSTEGPYYPSTYKWVENVALSGTFTKNRDMTDWLSGDSGIPNNWTVLNA